METKINSYLSFRIGEETFASHVSNVLNIIEMTKVTKVPQAPDYMKGVINLRGSVLPVIDTRMKFGMEEIAYTKDTCIIVLDVKVDNEEIFIGTIVDAVEEVLEIEKNDILPPPKIGSRFKSEFITGMYKKGDEEFIMLLNMELIFSAEDLDLAKEISQVREKMA